MAGVALITGAAHRIGKAIALHLAAEGYQIAIHCNTSISEAGEVAAAIENAGGKAAVFPANLRHEDETRALIGNVEDHFGSPVEVLVNNASIFEHDTAKDASTENWKRHMGTNLLAPFQLSQEMAARLPKGVNGNIINLIDQRVLRLSPAFFTYTLSKSALWTMTQTLAMEFAPRIRVNGIGPGPTLQSSHQSEDTFRNEAENVPLGRGPELDEIAKTISYIINTPSLTGQMMALDGGQHLAWQTPDFLSGGHE